MGEKRGPKELPIPGTFKYNYEKMSLIRLCVEYEVSKPTIRKWAIACGFKSKRRYITELSEDKLKEMLDRGMKPADIAKDTGFNYNSVINRLNDLGMSTKRTVTVDEDEFTRLYKSGYSYKQLGEHFGYSTFGMRSMVMKLGIYGR